MRALMPRMLERKSLKLYLHIFLLALVIGCSNHCALETVLSQVASKIFSLEQPEHLEHHLGADAEHRHENSSEPHEHGQPHPILAALFSKNANVVDALLDSPQILVTSLLGILAAVYSATSNLTVLSIESPWIPPGKAQIRSLTSAPQAPPLA